ncbi:MAG: 50S ribosomal protein L11 methyltransferase [Bacteroidetes bacterium]|jgi:ribosomal protein L11 methyltransferase|nr:50S ribosomal protein L11 methyltransferase [Bacteroidota bacterium]
MLQVTLSPCPEPQQELLIAELDDLAYDSYWQQPHQMVAYIAETDFDEAALQAVLAHYPGVQYCREEMPEQNWNQAWEQHYEPIAIPGVCYIHARFHPPAQGYPTVLCIQPQMSFGTGHHATTRLVIQALARQQQPYGRVLDMGCGTGILGIYALANGAERCDFYDIDPQCVENTRDNLALNGQQAHCVQVGEPAAIPDGTFYHTILANINRNILLQHAPAYAQLLQPGGSLYLSGFYTYDVPLLSRHVQALGLALADQWAEGEWACLRFDKG